MAVNVIITLTPGLVSTGNPNEGVWLNDKALNFGVKWCADTTFDSKKEVILKFSVADYCYVTNSKDLKAAPLCKLTVA
jgi:hypothetical protein